MSDSVYGLIDVSAVPEGSWDEEVDLVVCGLGAAGAGGIFRPTGALFRIS